VAPTSHVPCKCSRTEEGGSRKALAEQRTAKAPRLWQDWSKGIQRTRQLSAVHVPCMLEQCEGTLHGVTPWRRTTGAEPCEVKASSTVLNGGMRKRAYGRR